MMTMMMMKFLQSACGCIQFTNANELLSSENGFLHLHVSLLIKHTHTNTCTHTVSFVEERFQNFDFCFHLSNYMPIKMNERNNIFIKASLKSDSSDAFISFYSECLNIYILNSQKYIDVLTYFENITIHFP